MKSEDREGRREAPYSVNLTFIKQDKNQKLMKIEIKPKKYRFWKWKNI